MARVSVFQGGSVQRQPGPQERFRAADYGTGVAAAALTAAGKGLSEIAQKQDEIEDINARVEANRIAVEHSELTRQIGQRVKQTLGEGAEAAAEAGGTDLDTQTRELLGKASPRARALLENELRQRGGIAKDGWLEHGFTEKKAVFETSSVARINRIVEDAADEEDETKALTLLQGVREVNQQRARFFGQNDAWVVDQDRTAASKFYKGRALKLATGINGSAYAAIQYAEDHRSALTDDDYNALASAYHDNALDEYAAMEIDGAPVPSATVSVTPAEGDEPPQRNLDGTAFFKAFVAPHEGSAYVIDSNGYGVKYGVNAQYHPGEDIKGMTLSRAAAIFDKDYFKESGADKLPPGLAAVHADTYWLNKKEAKRILKESGGSADRYIELRRAFLNGLVAKNPGKYGRYKDGWENRTAALKDFADRQGGGTVAAPVEVGPDTSLTNFRATTMARTDIGLALKTKLISRVEARRADARNERALVEESAERQLTQSTTSLGDKFTDVKQLPQSAWLAASPATRARLTDEAKNNRENKPLTPEASAQIGYLKTFKPEAFADPKTRATLSKMGVPTKTLNELAEMGGEALGRRDSAKPAPVSTSALEAIARPVFEAAGVRLWTVEESGNKKGVEQQADAQMSLNLTNFLSDAARVWAINNPGKVADEATMKGWVATALIRNPQGQVVGTMSDARLLRAMPPADRKGIEQALRRNGIAITVPNIAQAYRRGLIASGAHQ